LVWGDQKNFGSRQWLESWRMSYELNRLGNLESAISVND
jgi:hypothetical protein